MDTIKSEYALMFKFLKSIRKQLLILALLFVVIAVIAYFAMGSLYQTQPEVIEEHIGELAEMLNTKDIIDEAGKMDAIKLFFGNFYAAMAAVSYGMIPFLFLPALSLLTNAAVIGVITAIFKAKEIGGVIDTLVGILPHGIFEIPALLLCVAFGLNLSLLGTRILRRKASKYDLYEFSAKTARALVLAVVPLLIAAAVVESY
ncbi:MAG: stage II sporulation protein M, partial [Oscillospiraceae bacterium]|nr:stage II sporulation protein M [Oscillospiraceae bacterium]